MAFLICGSENINKETTKQPDMVDKLGDSKAITMVIRRGKRGYGFSVTGSHPATVRRIEQGSTAMEAGLRIGDAVVGVNGDDVSSRIADSVAMTVRRSASHVILDVRRSDPERSNTSADWSDRPPTTLDPDCISLLSTREGSSADINDDTSRDHYIRLGHWEPVTLSARPLPAIQISFTELTNEQKRRQQTISGLRQCEQEFVDVIQSGRQLYLDPLRSRLVSPSEHVTLFNNVEKLASTSEEHIREIRREGIPFSDVTDSEQTYVDVIGSIYLPKVQLMATAFTQYCNGIKNSFRLLAELNEYDEFKHFLQQQQQQQGSSSGHSVHLTISDFIQKPLQHIKNIVLLLQEILSLTPCEHPDIENLNYVIDALRSTCNEINDCNTRRSRSMTSLVSRSSRRMSLTSTSSRSSASSGISSGSSTGSSVDCEVLDIQTRLVFPEHVKAFQLATATRHMIYSGELTHIDDPICTKLFVVLMSDLLLLTRVEQDNTLLVVDYPILLHEVVETDWTDETTTDFVIGVESGSNPAWMEPRDVTFTAPSIESKYTWKNILSHRIKCLRRQENNFNRSKIIV